MDNSEILLEKEDLVRLAKTAMPFGRYKGSLLIDLPEPYLLWFADKGFPEGRLGMLLKLSLEIKINGLIYRLQIWIATTISHTF